MTKKSHVPDMLSIYKAFYEFMDKPGFLPLIQYASKIFEAPIIFTDEHYHLISLYPTNKIDDFVYDTLLETGFLPIETIAAFQEAYLKEPGNRYEPFFAKEGLVKDLPRIFAEVYDEKKILGHIGIFVNAKEVKPWQLEATSILTSALRIKLNLTKHFTPTLSRNLNNLLDRNSSNAIKDRSLSNLSSTYSDPGILVVAPLDQNKAGQAFASVALNYCLHKFPNVVPTIYNNDLVILVTDQKKQSLSFMRKTAQKVADFLSQYNIICSAVYPIDNLYLLPDNYLQGKLTALLKFREGNLNTTTLAKKNKLEERELTYYHEIMPDPFYLYLSQNPEISSFIHPTLKIIRDYDKEYETVFLSTLKCYCLCLFQKNEASQMLHIHRNTLLYRLNRIEELFSLNLKDYRTLHHLLISFEIVKYQHSNKDIE